MTIEIKAPAFPESIAEGTIATWHKRPGEAINRDELIVDIETDKVVMEVVAPADGQISKILKEEGDTILSNEVIAEFAKGEGAAKSEAPQVQASAAAAVTPEVAKSEARIDEAVAGPAARKLISENNLEPSSISASGKAGRITKEDVLTHLNQPQTSASEALAEPQGERPEKRVPMTRLRATIAARLVQAQQTAAMLTTYNEVNMQPIMALRTKYKDEFQKAHNGVKLGFMSFFVKASVEALKRFPAVNASIDGSEIVYHGYQDIGVAVSTEKGLVVPVLRNTETMGVADIEASIAAYGEKARAGKLGIDEMTGGTFTISNGGVFGSLLSTPILNPPQTAILGMHKIQERPMAVEGEVKILPMMYLALSYDHRMIDGREAVQFLVTIKELLEDPARILLQV
ncbi:MAG: 2-oxoglutarate dehydrogenase complex dihydrolipoyllysine-residue succinyltransferase [Pseudomonadales bacterium]|nr:2-oxoglutarate dehydrogenase complex dihydrolipoyllysine-residue succinyltransferase [Pseudomonadales bacterium]MCP5303077.1 2-oxoglutarate dehydrogenase complex dihydrolipoyllysine-residue succinyltransferase [Pseudomonadales bacterium]